MSQGLKAAISPNFSLIQCLVWHEEPSLGFGSLPCPAGGVWSSPVAIVNLGSDFFLELSQFIFGQGPREDLGSPLYQAVGELLDMPELCGFVVLRQKKKGNFNQGKPGNLSSATLLKCVQLQSHTSFIELKIPGTL